MGEMESERDWRARCIHCGGIILFGLSHRTLEQCIKYLGEENKRLAEEIKKKMYILKERKK